MNRIIAKLRGACRRFAGANEGNTLITFALAFIPLVGLTGAAVDYSRAQSVQTAMQAAADTTALMIAQTANSQTAAQLETQATTVYQALFTRSDASGLSITATYTATGSPTIVVNATATYKTSFMGVIGFSSLPLAASSTASFGNSRLRVALVLDNTGSMADSGKITALKTATNNLLTQLQAAVVNPGDVYVSIIPFVVDVNVDPVNASANWIYWDDAAHSDNNSWDALNGSCSAGSFYTTRQACNGAPGGSCSISGYTSASTCQGAGTCSISGNTTQSSCQAAGGTCSLAGYGSQSTCDAAGTCSLSAYSSQSTCQAAGTCSISSKTSQSTCQAAGTCSISSKTSQSTCQAAGTCSNPTHTTQTSCQRASDIWTPGVWTPAVWTPGVWHAAVWTPPGVWTAGVWTGPTWTPNAHSTWDGCVMDRGDSTAPDAGNYDTNVAAIDTTNTATMYAAQQYTYMGTDWCPQAAMGLSYDWSAMTTEVNNMTPTGATNQNIGLQLGWMSLVGGGPFTAPALDPDYTYQQVIILLTDGLNNTDRWYSTQSQVDARQSITCTNIKNAGIIIYTVQVDTDGSPTSTLLQQCATDSSKYFMLTSSSAIVTTFNTIATNLSRLRIAK